MSDCAAPEPCDGVPAAPGFDPDNMPPARESAVRVAAFLVESGVFADTASYPIISLTEVVKVGGVVAPADRSVCTAKQWARWLNWFRAFLKGLREALLPHGWAFLVKKGDVMFLHGDAALVAVVDPAGKKIRRVAAYTASLLHLIQPESLSAAGLTARDKIHDRLLGAAEYGASAGLLLTRELPSTAREVRSLATHWAAGPPPRNNRLASMVEESDDPRRRGDTSSFSGSVLDLSLIHI